MNENINQNNNGTLDNTLKQTPEYPEEIITALNYFLKDGTVVRDYLWYFFPLDQLAHIVKANITRFVETVLKRARITNKEYVIEWVESDMDRIVFWIGDQEYTIRTWEINPNGKIVFTLYKIVADNENEYESYGEPVRGGVFYMFADRRHPEGNVSAACDIRDNLAQQYES